MPPAPTPSPSDPGRSGGRISCFLSHSSQDAPAVRLLRTLLESSGIACWIAPDSLGTGAPWASQIVDAIEACSHLVVFVSPAACRSEHVAREVSLALDLGRRVIPARLSAVEPSGALRYLLQLLQRVDLFPGPVDQHGPALLALIEGRTGAPAGRPAGTLPPPPQPAPVAGPRIVTALALEAHVPTAVRRRLGREETTLLLAECLGEAARLVGSASGTVVEQGKEGLRAAFGLGPRREHDAVQAALVGGDLVRLGGVYDAGLRDAWGSGGFGLAVGLQSARIDPGPGHPTDGAMATLVAAAGELAGRAGPGRVVAGPETARLVGRTVELAALEPAAGAMTGDGPGPMLVRGPRVIADHWRTPLVARAPEVRRVAAVIRDEAATGRGRVVLVSGEAGVGKSRFLGELRRRVRPRVGWLQAGCAGPGSLAPLRPVLDLVAEGLGLAPETPPLAARMRLRSLAARLGLEAADMAVVAEQLGVVGPAAPWTGAPAAPTDLPAVLVRVLGVLAAASPTVMALDDLHLADEATLRCVLGLLAVTDDTGLLLVLCHRPRPEVDRGLLDVLDAARALQHRLTEVALQPLDRVAAGRLVRSIVPPVLGPDVMRSIVERGGGNPFALEELSRSVVEDSPRARSWTLSSPIQADIPLALEAVVAARIDRLSPAARAWLAAAAVLGPRFAADEVEAVVEGAGDALREVLRSELITEERRLPTRICAFTQGLARDVILASLPDAEAAALHARAAEVLRRSAAGEERLGELAEHLARAGSLEEAAATFEAAADRAEALGMPGAAEPLRARAVKVRARLGPGRRRRPRGR